MPKGVEILGFPKGVGQEKFGKHCAKTRFGCQWFLEKVPGSLEDEASEAETEKDSSFCSSPECR